MKDLSRIILVLIIFGNSIVKADTYWVSPTGTATWSAAKSAVPLNGTNCCNIETANENATAGDTVYIRGGFYNNDIFINPKNNGTSWENQITFSAYNGETVTVSNQICPNRRHETGAWAATNGAIVEHSNLQAWDGDYSTKFSVNDALQGIRSNNFSIENNGNVFSAWVLSDQNSINVYINKGGGTGSCLDEDFPVTPNEWSWIGKTIAPGTGTNSYVSFHSPAGQTSGTWYVDNVRVHYYQPSILLKMNEYIKVHGIDFKACLRGFDIQDNSNNNEISYCSFTDTEVITNYSANIIFCGNGLPSSYNWIHHCTFHDIGFVSNCDDKGSSLRIGIEGGNSRYNLIEDCVFYHGAHDQINITTRYNTLRNNVFHNEGWMRNFNYDSGGCPSAAGGYNNPVLFGGRNIALEGTADNSGYCLIENNRIGHAGTPPDDDGGNGIENATDGIIVRHNYIYSNGTAGIFFKPISNLRPHDNRIYNNTIFHNGRGFDIAPGFQAGITYSEWPTDPLLPTGNIIINNIVFDNIDSYQNAGNGDPAFNDHLIYELNTYINNLETDPLFANPDINDPTNFLKPDLSLMLNSPAIDKGMALTSVANADDGNGVELVVNDAGYFQDGSWAPTGKVNPDRIAVGTVGNTVQISSIDYDLNTITLKNEITRENGDSVWLYMNSSGTVVLHGSSPDIGAYEYIDSTITELPQIDNDSTGIILNIYPNPFNTRTRISYNIQETGTYKLAIYNFHGQLVKNLSNKEHQAGSYEILWEGNSNSGATVSNGVYYLIISGESFYEFAKIVVLR